MKSALNYAVKHLLHQTDTSFLLFDLDHLSRRLEVLASAFGPSAMHAVAIKTNPQPAVLRHLVEEGAALEAASFAEVLRASKAGVPADRVVFDSPVKTRSELAALEHDFPGAISNVNSLAELERYEPKTSIRLGLRLNPNVSSSPNHLYDVTGERSQFGVSVLNREAIERAVREYPIVGLHTHPGSGVTDIGTHLNALRPVARVMKDLMDRGHAFSFLDVGGGLSSTVTETAMRAYGSGVQELFSFFNGTLITEFGQWVHAGAGCVFSRVEYVEEKPDGIHLVYLHVGADLFMRDVYGTSRRYPVSVCDPDGEPKPGRKALVQLVGPLCFAGDQLFEPMELPLPSEGDWVAIGQAGANTYGLWSRHCSRDVPKVLAATQGDIRVVQERQPIAY